MTGKRYDEDESAAVSTLSGLDMRLGLVMALGGLWAML